MKSYEQDSDKQKNIVQEDRPVYGSREEMEDARLKKILSMSDIEKFRLFCRMMRIGKMLASAKISHH